MCRICKAKPEIRSYVEDSLNMGVSVRKIEKSIYERFHKMISYKAIWRHKTYCMKGIAPPSIYSSSEIYYAISPLKSKPYH